MASVRLFDPNKNIFVTVNKKFAEKLKSEQGLTEQRPSQKQISDIESSAREGVQKFTTPTGGTTTTRPTLPKLPPKKETAPISGVQPDAEVDTRAKIAERKKQAAVKGFQEAFKTTRGRLKQEEAGLEPRFREQRARTLTEAEMARTGAEKGLATMGLAGSGARAQTELGQQIGTQAALGRSRAQEAEQRADIERRLSEAQSLRDQGIATAQSEADIVRLQDELRRIGIQEERDVFAREQEKQDFISTIDRFSQDFTQEIQNILADGDPSNDWKIPLLESARAKKVAGIETGRAEAGRDAREFAMDKWNKGIPLNQEEMQLLGTTRSTKPVKPTGGTTQAQLFNQADKLVSRGIPLNAAQAAAYGVEEGFVDPNFEGLTPEDEDTTPSFSDSDINFSISRAIKNDAAGLESFEITPQMQIESVKNWLISNGGNISDEQLSNIVLRYGLSDADIDDMDAKTSPNRQEAGVGGLNLP